METNGLSWTVIPDTWRKHSLSKGIRERDWTGGETMSSTGKIWLYVPWNNEVSCSCRIGVYISAGKCIGKNTNVRVPFINTTWSHQFICGRLGKFFKNCNKHIFIAMNPLTLNYYSCQFTKISYKGRILKNHTDVLKKGVNFHGYVHNF